MPPYHAIVRGLCHDSTPLLLSVGDLGTPVAVCYVALFLAQPKRSGTGHITPPPRGQLSKELKPVAGLTQKPFCAACEHDSPLPQPSPPVPPDPMPATHR